MPKSSMGTKLKIGANSIAELSNIGGMELSADTVDITTHDVTDGYRRFMQGLKDAGEVTASGFFNPGDTNGQKALIDAFESGTETAFVILFPAAFGAEWDFNGIVTKISTGEADMENPVPFEATIKVSGKPSLGLTASAGLSGLELTGTGGTLAPAFDASKYNYAFTGVTAASVTVKATAASHTLQLYVDGVFNQNLTSGSASTAIALSVGSYMFDIIAYEAGKTQKVYSIVVEKAS